MESFIIGLIILAVGYFFYSKYVENQFEPTNKVTPAYKLEDGVDFIPLSPIKTRLLHFLNIAGLGPILGAIQGILFGPIAFILIPLGCVFMGAVHDYFAGMISIRNNGMQITELIKKYLGKHVYAVFILIITILLLLVTIVFVYTTGDIIASFFFKQTDLSLANPYIVTIYSAIAVYYILATLLPIDKIMAKIYPFFAILLIAGTVLVTVGFITKGMNLTHFSFNSINMHPKHLAIIPTFFVTVSCGLLSGFHSSQATIISRTLKTEKEGKKTFFKMMCYESVIAMIWAAAAMCVYNLAIVPSKFIATPEVINIINAHFIPVQVAFIVTLAVVILPITSGDTALRGFRLIVADLFKIEQKDILKRLVIMVPTIIVLITGLIAVKVFNNNFALLWRYFGWFNQMIALPTLFLATKFLYDKNKNYFITLIPAIFYTFIIISFILNSEIGLNVPIYPTYIISTLGTIATVYAFYKFILKGKNE